MICSKIANFNHTEAGLTSKWGRISPTVQWCCQNQSNCTIRRCTTSLDIAKKFFKYIHTHINTYGHRDKATHRARLPLLKITRRTTGAKDNTYLANNYMFIANVILLVTYTEEKCQKDQVVTTSKPSKPLLTFK